MGKALLSTFIVVGLLGLVTFAYGAMWNDRTGVRAGELALGVEAYAKAVRAFEAAHGRPPVLGSSTWPDGAEGPVWGRTRYLSVPKVFRDHPFLFVQAPGDAPAGAPAVKGRLYVVEYYPHAPGGFALRIVDRDEHSTLAGDQVASCVARRRMAHARCQVQLIGTSPLRPHGKSRPFSR